ncbi:MAG: patatin-like phospholipase family protein [Spirochaetes bacterium]|nr:patatin-like phospholipase family protein [Spirochaetota bacterium]
MFLRRFNLKGIKKRLEKLSFINKYKDFENLEIRNIIKFYKDNLNFIKEKVKKIKDYDLYSLLEDFREKLENKIFTVQKIKDYIRERYFNPDIEYKNVNVPVKSDLITKKVILVLSGGGARGAAHIGVLKRIEELEIQPEVIIGTSVGSIVGALYSAGYNADNIYQILKKEYSQLVKLGRFFFLKPKTATNLLRNILIKYLDHMKFEDLKIPLYLNVADVNNCKRVIFNKGQLVDIILASSAIPFVMDSIKIDDMLLMDGGVCDNFCVDFAKKLNCEKNLDIIISDVSAATDYSSDISFVYFLFKISQDFVDFVKKIGKVPIPVNNKKDLFAISNNLLYLLNKRKTIGPEDIDGTEIIVTPLLFNMGIQDFDKVFWAYEAGYETSKKVFV